ncbi:MAG: IS66 family transposase [bacterium]|nr:IS66 family transposase [bacterium]
MDAGLCPQCLGFKAKADLAQGEAVYWRVMHGRAVAREGQLKVEIVDLKAKLRQRERELFGRKSEQSKGKNQSQEGEAAQRRRGQQRGSRGHGRRRHVELPAVEESYDLDPAQRRCPRCQRAFEALAGSEDSEVVEVEVRAYRRVIRRQRYRPTCQCPRLPGIVTPPCPAKLIPKGGLGVSVWVLILIDKFLFQRPTYRLLADLRWTHGVRIAQGTVTGGLARLLALFEPLVKAIVAKSLSENHWHADETRWPVFATWEGKQGNRWQMWVIVSKSTAVFQLEPTRSGKVVLAYFGQPATGILNVDRYAGYKVLLQGGRIVLAYCWAHVRRDFLEVAKDWGGQHGAWALGWVECIGELYRLNAERLRVLDDPQAYPAAQEQLRAAVERMARWREAELADPLGIGCRHKVLKSLAAHWAGLVVFVDHPQVPMDNNTAERTHRNAVVGRKNYYGSGAQWSGKLAATMFTIFQTLLLWKLNPRLWLSEYLQACAQNGGRAPADAESFLPWNLNDAQRSRLAAPPAGCDSS